MKFIPCLQETDDTPPPLPRVLSQLIRESWADFVELMRNPNYTANMKVWAVEICENDQPYVCQVCIAGATLVRRRLFVKNLDKIVDRRTTQAGQAAEDRALLQSIYEENMQSWGDVEDAVLPENKDQIRAINSLREGDIMDAFYWLQANKVWSKKAPEYSEDVILPSWARHQEDLEAFEAKYKIEPERIMPHYDKWCPRIFEEAFLKLAADLEAIGY